MILYPAIDLKDGQCVRLLHGEMDKATVFGDDPAAQAAKFEAAGCEWVHLVDLNGAFAGAPVNGAAVEAILKSVQETATMSEVDALKLEFEIGWPIFATNDSKEGPRAFAEKRAPNWTRT